MLYEYFPLSLDDWYVAHFYVFLLAREMSSRTGPGGEGIRTLTLFFCPRMPPVDAIYRPHVVHHTIVPPEVQAQQTKSKTKRYFAAE
jgi:hypothetical protein